LALALPFSAITVCCCRWRARAAQQGGDRQQGMIGETGSAVTELAPEGKVFVHGEYWDAVVARGPCPPARACASPPSAS
jgi:membrane-bound ClpP family serine protease